MNKEDKTKNLPQKEEKKPQGAAFSQGRETDLSQLLMELQALRQRERDWVFREDLEKLRKAFPDMAPESIPQLGDDFLKMRSMGIDPLIASSISQRAAIYALRQAEEAMRPETPPMMGPADGQSEGEEGFFAPEEVRRMTPEQVEANLKKIEKSQRRW